MWLFRKGPEEKKETVEIIINGVKVTKDVEITVPLQFTEFDLPQNEGEEKEIEIKGKLWVKKDTSDKLRRERKYVWNFITN